jgi:DNA polymerase-4
MEKYKAESAEIMRLITLPGSVLEQMSIDEAYLEMSSTVQSQPDANPFATHDQALNAVLPLARELKERIRSERNLTATIGIAANKLLAKLASDFQKPDGLTLIPEAEKVAFLLPLPVRVLHGVGKVTEEVLHGAGLRTIGDLQDYTGDLRPLVGSFASRLKAFAFGEDDRPLEVDDTIKSISSEETFLRDTEDRAILRASLRTQADEVSGKLQRHRLCAQTIQVKLRYSDFSTLTRQITLEEPVLEAREIYRMSCWLLGRERLVNRPLRLLGVGVSHLDLPSAKQLAFKFTDL